MRATPQQVREAQEAGLELGLTIIVETVLLGVVVLLLWPLDRLALGILLAKGFGLFFLAICAVTVLLMLVHRIFRIDDDTHFDAYLLTNLAGSALLLVGWAAFAALAVRGAAAGAPVWKAAILWFLGLFTTSQMAFSLVSGFYSGSFYRTINLPLSAAVFLLFALWPAAAHFLFGWLS
ncbi:MAG TPA: hypothetical protein VFX98_14795 [Longimicrobiaceae bacterium]|nr:hypothetical protein [Longimicrobiaceae bacterium]